MRALKLCIWALCLSLMGCGSTPQRNDEAKIVDPGAKFYRLLAEFKQQPDSVPYLAFWHSYLASDQKDNTGPKQTAFEQLIYKLETQEMTCSEVDWPNVTEQNFWSIKPHLAAQSCYESMGDSTSAAFHGATVAYFLNGILGQNTGENAYTAYEIATWGDASDVIEFAEYDVVDTYLTLKHKGQALFYVYVVNDPETGQQREVYFENNKFLHEVLGIQYPFAGIQNQLESQIVDHFAKTDAHAQIAKANLLIGRQQFNEAIKLYQLAAAQDSAVAYTEMGLLCFHPQQTVISKEDCLEFLFKGAELGYLKASIAIALLYKEGVFVEQDTALHEELMASIAPHLQPGEAWRHLAQLYQSHLVEGGETGYLNSLQKAADLGDRYAKLLTIGEGLSRLESGDENRAELDTLLNRLEALAEEGMDTAQVAHAKVLMKLHSKGQPQWETAKVWLQSAAKSGNPEANALMGDAYQYGYFGEKDFTKAYMAYNEAALKAHAKAQLQVGYMNDIGRVVETNKDIALMWYFLCAKSNNLTCMRNVGVFFRDGIAVEKDYARARSLFQFASDRGHAHSTTTLALMHWFGQGGEKDQQAANALFEKGCDLKHGEACNHLGTSYLDGEGLPQDTTKANAMFLLACDLNYSDGCNGLGNSYERGRGVKKDFKKAAAFYEKSCELDNAMSCSNLGYLYNHGNGVDKDPKKARALYLRACNGGNEIGCDNYRSTL